MMVDYLLHPRVNENRSFIRTSTYLKSEQVDSANFIPAKIDSFSRKH